MSLLQAFLNTARLFAGSTQPSTYPKTVASSKEEPARSLLTLARENLAKRRAAREAARRAEEDETVFLEDEFPLTRISLH